MTQIQDPATTDINAHESLLAGIAGTLNSVEELQDFLDRVVESVRANIDGCDEVGITLLLDGRASTAAYTTVTTLDIDAIQYQLDEGPCLEAARTRSENRVSVLEAAERWPQFAQAARNEDMQSLMALPLISGDKCVGALNLYGYAPHAFDNLEVSLARVAASRAADAIVAVLSLEDAKQLAGQLEQAMASRAAIEQAKGVLMAMRGIDEHSAFEWLRQVSQDRNVKVRDLAQQVISGVRAQDSTAG